MKVQDMNIGQLAGYSFKCECNKTHKVDIEEVVIKKDAIKDTIEFLNKKTSGTIMIICDENTYEIAGRIFEKTLPKSETYIIKEKNNLHVSPNESFVGEVLIKIPKDIDYFLAVGSGVINDITRQISYKMGKDYIVFGTAPSMDGYASVTSSLIINNVKESIQGQSPKAIFADIDILKQAPFEMITAGFGDVIGKYNAIREWQFGRDYKNEHYCPTIVELVTKAVKKCEKSAKQLINRDEAAIKSVMEALTLAGMTMTMYQNTRPASGAEHHIVHYWDVDCIKRGVKHPLHGNSVGVGTVIICKVFELLKGKLPVEVMDIDENKIIKILKSAGCKTSPVELNISRELLKESIIKGHTMSTKYTVLTYLAQENPKLLEEVAEKICNMYY